MSLVKKKTSWIQWLVPVTIAAIPVGILTIVVFMSLMNIFDSADNYGEIVSARFIQSQIEEIQNGKSSQLMLYDTRNTDAYLAEIDSLAGLQDLHLDRTDVTDDGINNLAKLPGLELLSITGGRITNNAIICLSSAPKLRRLELYDTLISDEGISELSQISSRSSGEI